MTTLENSQAVPLTVWEDGSIRVAGSRVTLDSVVQEFKLGATAEQVLHSFPSVTLREVYGAIFYYLNNTEAVKSTSVSTNGGPKRPAGSSKVT